jgi:hypothetical protein
MNVMEQTPVWTSFESRLAASYSKFAEAEYGAGCYQSAPEYLEWLYRENPCSRGFEDLSIAVVGDDVVGCIHKMYLPWMIAGELCKVPTLHNLVVQEKYRSGAGFWLLKRSIHREEHAVIPGVLPPLSEAYKHMKCQQAPTRWFRKVLRPINGGVRLALRRVGARLAGSPSKFSDGIVTQPNAEQLAAIAEILTAEAGRDHVAWTPELVRWRFFHSFGPRHAYVEFGKPGAFALLSLGPRNGLLVGRLIFMSSQAIGLGQPAAKQICRTLRRAGAHAALAMTVRDDLSNLLQLSGFRTYPLSPDTYLFHRDKSFVQDTSVGPEVTDFGFEAIIYEDSASRHVHSFA